MPDKTGRYTPQELAFIKGYVVTGDAQQAAVQAGYRQPRSQGYQALARPAIAAEVARLQLERISNELLPLAVDVHMDLLTNKATPAGAKVQAVKLAYDRAFGAQDAAGGKEAHEMTGAELAAEIDKLRHRQAEIAKPIIDHEPSPGGVFE